MQATAAAAHPCHCWLLPRRAGVHAHLAIMTARARARACKESCARRLLPRKGCAAALPDHVRLMARVLVGRACTAHMDGGRSGTPFLIACADMLRRSAVRCAALQQPWSSQQPPPLHHRRAPPLPSPIRCRCQAGAAASPQPQPQPQPQAHHAWRSSRCWRPS